MSTFTGTGCHAYGVSADEHPRTKSIGDVQWPEPELTDGVHQIHVKSYGDDPMVLFISVTATSAASAVEHWCAVRDSLTKTKQEWWP